jgi:hypothetical protein
MKAMNEDTPARIMQRITVKWIGKPIYVAVT